VLIVAPASPAVEGSGYTYDLRPENRPKTVTLDDLRGVRLRAMLYSGGISMAEANDAGATSLAMCARTVADCFTLTTQGDN
jgi:hypothetical protein